MRLFTCLLFLGLLTTPHRLAAQHATPETVAVAGQVLDARTGTPLAGAHVFLARSMQGTITDADGTYRLGALPPGGLEIAASMLGFDTQTQRLHAAADSLVALTFALQPIVLPLGEVVVAAERPEHWAEHLARFQELFLGSTENAERSAVINPEVLDFSYDADAERLRATAHAPVVIENRALGYRVYYHLREFIAAPNGVRYLGTSRFEELAPRNKRERRRWERRRRKTYEGSLQHFLTALFDTGSERAARKAGFTVAVAPRFDTEPTVSIPLREPSLLRPSTVPESRLLAFAHHLMIIYKPDVPPAAPAGVPGMGSAPPPLHEYASWITLNHGPAEIDRFGHLYDPYAVTTFGRWSRERLADLLPRDYQPR